MTVQAVPPTKPRRPFSLLELMRSNAYHAWWFAWRGYWSSARIQVSMFFARPYWRWKTRHDYVTHPARLPLLAVRTPEGSAVSLFQCEECGCCENTALSMQGFRLFPDSYDWTPAPERKGKKLPVVVPAAP